MYTKRVQILNYGPIDHLDIPFPFEDETPKPLVLVGENGSGKTIFLSHVKEARSVPKNSVNSRVRITPSPVRVSLQMICEQQLKALKSLLYMWTVRPM